ncbi:MAG: PP2C family protein-serine/threonine phosphatase [Bacillota bacterium]
MILKTILKAPQPLLWVIFLLIISKLILKYNDKTKQVTSKMNIGNAQNIGNRKRQEDSFATLVDEEQVLAVIADGMGGFNSGKKASELVTNKFMEQFCRTYDINSINQFLINSLHNSNNELLQRASAEKIGTTLITIVIKKDLLYWVAVGDSHLYLYRNKQLRQLNTDHIFANKLQQSYKDGEISRYKMLNHPQKDRLTSYLGLENLSLIDYSNDPVELKKNDKIVLCTDGVYDSLSEVEFSQIMSQNKEVQKLANDIISKVISKEKPNQDNATVVLLEKN